MASIKKSNILAAIGRYYNTLSHVGTVPRNECYKLLVCLFLLDLINTDLSFFVTEEDYDKIGRLYRDMLGSCILPYDQFCNERSQVGSPVVHVEGLGIGRMTETEDGRFVEVSGAERMIENLTWFSQNGF